MKRILFFLVTLGLIVQSCSKEKTNYEREKEHDIPEHHEFKEVFNKQEEGYKISLEALNGTLYKGYNEIRVKITPDQLKGQINTVTSLPIGLSATAGQISGPHRYQLIYQPEQNYYSGYIVFVDPSSATLEWDLYLSFKVDEQSYRIKQRLSVQAQLNKNLGMTSFIGKDKEQYFIALVAPQKPKVGLNSLLAGVYKYNKPKQLATGDFPDASQFSFTEVKDYVLQLDPRMPEPSMGNHSSPNNKDLIQQTNGLYQGQVNYTMTGNWTLNFILSNAEGRILKGTVVPDDFTPGVAGVKSELFIDILF